MAKEGSILFKIKGYFSRSKEQPEKICALSLSFQALSDAIGNDHEFMRVRVNIESMS